MPEPKLTIYDANLMICGEPSSGTPPPLGQPSFTARTETNLIPFQPKASVVTPRAVPDANASIGDKMQWLALEMPNALDMIHEMAEAVIQPYRAPAVVTPSKTRPDVSPAPAATLELSSAYEYRDVREYTRGALVVPPEHIMGRTAYDVLPPDLLLRFDRAAARSRRTKRAAYLAYTTDAGQWRAHVITPSKDTIIVTAHPLRTR